MKTPAGRATPLPPVVTCGEPAGIGPEIAAAAWRTLGADLPFAWIGDPLHLPRDTPWQAIDGPKEAVKVAARALPVIRQDFPSPVRPGHPDTDNARAVVSVIARAVEAVQAGAAGAVVTAPIQKAALQDGAGFAFPGHTEYLAHLAGDVPVAMMLACPQLRVVPVTIHCPLSEVPARLSAAALESALRLTDAALRRDFGVTLPRIAVSGLNPHAGEAGHMGREEIDLIEPVLVRLRAEGLVLSGPHPADTMFHAAARARYDAAVCMYHDQALIPIKTLDFSRGVNITLGLPFVRTSPDHGTALDIAGKGHADPSSMIAALRVAADMVRSRVTAG